MIRVGRRRAADAAVAAYQAPDAGPLPPQLPDQVWREIVLYLEFWQLVAESAARGGTG
jgi:hypothetical protein